MGTNRDTRRYVSMLWWQIILRSLPQADKNRGKEKKGEGERDWKGEMGQKEVAVRADGTANVWLIYSDKCKNNNSYEIKRELQGIQK